MISQLGRCLDPVALKRLVIFPATVAINVMAATLIVENAEYIIFITKKESGKNEKCK